MKPYLIMRWDPKGGIFAVQTGLETSEYDSEDEAGEAASRLKTRYLGYDFYVVRVIAGPFPPV